VGLVPTAPVPTPPLADPLAGGAEGLAVVGELAGGALVVGVLGTAGVLETGLALPLATGLCETAVGRGYAPGR
jgi:hypothetical protein